MSWIGEGGRDIRGRVFRRRREDMRREMKVRPDRMLMVATALGIILEDIQMPGIILIRGMVLREEGGIHSRAGERERIHRGRGIHGVVMGVGLTDRMGSIDIESGMREGRPDGSEGAVMFMCRVIARDGGMTGIETEMIGVVVGAIEMIVIMRAIQEGREWIMMTAAGGDVPGAEPGAHCH